MTLQDRIFNRLFQTQVKRIQEETAAQLADEVRQGHWRSLDINSNETPYSIHRQNQLDSIEAYRSNPMASRIIDIVTDYTLGQGVALSASPKYIDTFVQSFWRHPLNNLQARLRSMSQELALTGELFLTFHTNPYDGMTYVRIMPSTSIDEIHTSDNDPETPISYHQVAIGNQAPERTWSAEDMKHYPIRALAGTQRGQGDLVTSLPWLRRYKDWLTDRVIINKYKGAYLWDVTLTGATAASISQKKNELSEPPPSGSILVHNEAEVWKPIQPQINADNAMTDGRALRMMISAGTSTPLHYLGEGTEYNRAVAETMGEPVRKHHQNRQEVLAHIARDFTTIAIERARSAGILRRTRTPYTITLGFPDLSSQDNLALAQATAAISQAIDTAVERGILTPAEAREWLYNTSQQTKPDDVPEPPDEVTP